ncbi:cytidylate kinase [Rickettsiella grylli]|uniref:(d)CMP kinase n=1 Tax=Rickettsiella grylli TaxID=59196 RepID=UPI0008FD4FF7|nr:(d)CMP kinase [Rickettsiella grylli]OIZ99931.1 cytidylate kinase [Rickettsiella grylli]
MLLTTENSAVSVITIDGLSGSGKGTLGQLLARDLSWHFLDSGAIYRAAAWIALSTQTPFEEDKLLPLMGDLSLHFSAQPDQTQQVFWDKQEITASIRTTEIGQLASQLGMYPQVRKALLAYQRAFRRAPGLVADGRDMGSVVFPDALLKIFLTASLEERAKRRYLQLKPMRKHVSLNAVRAELKLRDRRDKERRVAPLIVPLDAITIDTTSLGVQEALQIIKSKLACAQAKKYKGGH